jgi:hypothetical protein
MQAAGAMSAVGSVVQGVGGLLQGNANSRALKRQSREELIAGAEEESRVRDAARATMGDQVAAQFSNGFQGGSGSALDALRESKVNATLDALAIRRQAMGKARSLTAQARQAKMEGRFALLSGILQAGSKVAQQRTDWADARRGQTPRSAPRPEMNSGLPAGRKGPV